MTQDPMCPYQPGQSSYTDSISKNRYTPEVSSGVLDNMPAADTIPTVRGTVLLQYPYDTLTTTLELRSPELNDQAIFQAYRVQTYSRGDTQIIYRDPSWFMNRVYNWAFSGLTRQNRIDILAFVVLSAGKYIKVTDYWSRTYKAIIINPDNTVTQELPDYATQDGSGLPGAGYTWKIDLQRALA
jgi:hypothetical protein